jgi:DNA polymerase III delta prime subunit
MTKVSATFNLNLPEGFGKAVKKRMGAKVLFYGPQGVGKTLAALSFPKVVAIDSEDGMGWYEGTDRAKNLLAVQGTQDFYAVTDSLKDLKDAEGFDTVVIDSETKIAENLQHVYLTVEERRAMRKGGDVEDANISMRAWGKIKQIQTNLQNLKIDLASKGINIVSVAQQVEIKEKFGSEYKIVGYRPDMKKKAEHDYDIVVRLITEGSGKDLKYYGIIEKDRTEVTHAGQKIQNPSYDIWKERIEAGSGLEAKESEFSEETEKNMARHEEEVEKEEISSKDRFQQYYNGLDEDGKKKAATLLSKLGIKSLSKMTAAQSKKLGELMDKLEAVPA